MEKNFVLRCAACGILVRALGSAVVTNSSGSRKPSLDAFPTAPALFVGPEGQLGFGLMGSGLQAGSGLGAGQISPRERCLSGSSVPKPRLLVRCVGRGLGHPLGRRHCFRPVVSRGSGSLYQRQGAPGVGERFAPVCASDLRFHCGNLCQQLDGSGLLAQARGNSVSGVELHSAKDPLLGRISPSGTGSPVHQGEEQCSSGLCPGPIRSRGPNGL